MDWYTVSVTWIAPSTRRSARWIDSSSGTAVAWTAVWLPEMRPFHRDPRFQTFCQRLGLFDYWNTYGPPDNCELREGRLVC
jgi:hypothetical protein